MGSETLCPTFLAPFRVHYARIRVIPVQNTRGKKTEIVLTRSPPFDPVRVLVFSFRAPHRVFVWHLQPVSPVARVPFTRICAIIARKHGDKRSLALNEDERGEIVLTRSPIPLVSLFYFPSSCSFHFASFRCPFSFVVSLDSPFFVPHTAPLSGLVTPSPHLLREAESLARGQGRRLALCVLPWRQMASLRWGFPASPRSRL